MNGGELGEAVYMHIPDGYLSPQTCAVGYVIAVPVWALAVRKVKRVVRTRHAPTLALFAAVSFLVMMFNIPIPDGTTAHAVGAAVIALVLGPWAAVIAVSVALAFQALLFGDGGLLSYGFNVVNMAIIMPFVAYGVYRLIAGRSGLTSGRRLTAAVLAGYVGINAAALAAAVEFGLQPELFARSDGTPLYAPYHLAQTIPAMMLAHLTLAGAAEAILTGGVLAYLQRANLPLLRLNHPGVPGPDRTGDTPTRRRLRPGPVAGVAMAVMVLITPIGLLAPGGAFGEDAPGNLDLTALHLSAVPAGLHRYSTFWQHALLPGYGSGTVGYLLSALVGVLVVGLVVYAVTKIIQLLARRRASAGARADGGAEHSDDGIGHSDATAVRS